MGAWSRSMDTFDGRRVAETTIGTLWVSTVFLGLDHNFGEGPPLLFESMAFPDRDKDGYQDEMQERYYTWDEAIAGHKAMVEAVRNLLAQHEKAE